MTEGRMPMSAMQFDGKKVYRFMSASQAEYEIRGTQIHKAHSASQAVYEIR
jgi:hypothetical protein